MPTSLRPETEIEEGTLGLPRCPPSLLARPGLPPDPALVIPGWACLGEDQCGLQAEAPGDLGSHVPCPGQAS